MSEVFSDENFKSAFFRSLTYAGLTIFETAGEKKLSEKILTVVPAEKLKHFSQTLRQSAVYICTREPYLWQVGDSTPLIDENTTFEDLYNQWFRTIIS